jgi:hypothetical protein
MANKSKYYPETMLKDKKGWAEFAGRCYLIGLINDIDPEMVQEYIFETYHGLGLDEIPKTAKAIKEDMLLYIAS